MRTKKTSGLVASLDLQIKTLLRRRKALARLERKKVKIEARLEKLNRRISRLTGVAAPVGRPAGAGRKGKRAPRGALTAGIIEVLAKAGKPLSVGEVTEKLQASGTISASKDLSKNVSNTLYNSKRFKRAGRGVFVVAK